jgi:hypothetical protein
MHRRRGPADDTIAVMSEDGGDTLEPAVRDILQPDEDLHIQVRSIEATLAVTNRRLIVANGNRVILDLPFEQLRRVEFDLERGHPATLVIVPDSPSDRPQVLSIPPEEYERTAMALARIGERLDET